MLSAFAILSVPTLWTVFIVNFLAQGLFWAYVMRSYPTFLAARFWAAMRAVRKNTENSSTAQSE